MKNFTIFLVVMLLVGCQNRGNPKDTVQDGDFKIEFLFEKDGCKMYRFKDGYRYIYWANCAGKVQADYTTSTGKTTTTHHEETITTE